MSVKSSSLAVISSRPENAWRYANPLHMARNLWAYRDLLRQFTRREVLGRYKGSYLGILWSFLTPFLMLAVYTFVFSVVFRARWGNSSSESRVEFALTLFCGLIAFNVFSECVSRAPGLIAALGFIYRGVGRGFNGEGLIDATRPPRVRASAPAFVGDSEEEPST